MEEWSCDRFSPAGALRISAGSLALFSFSCYLIFLDWRVTPIFMIVVVEIVLGFKMCVRWLNYVDRASESGKCPLCGVLLTVGRLCLAMGFCMAFTAAWWSHRYAVVMDPATTLRWITSGQLSYQLELHPQTHVIMLQDGYAKMSLEGHFARETCSRAECRTTHFSAVPVYGGRAGAGLPFAWAVGQERVVPEYCGVGLCGYFRGRMTASGGALGEEQVGGAARAAQRAASLGNFSYVDGLPMIETTDLVEHAQYAQWWHLRFWWLFWGSVVLACVADSDAVDAWRKHRGSAERLPLTST